MVDDYTPTGVLARCLRDITKDGVPQELDALTAYQWADRLEESLKLFGYAIGMPNNG